MEPFKPKNYQIYNQKYLNVNNIPDKLIIFHGTGAGKTCIATLIAESYRRHLTESGMPGNIYILGSNITKENFYKELIGPCGNAANLIPPYDENIFVTEEEKIEIENVPLGDKGMYNKLRKRFIKNRLANAGYHFYTYQKFRNQQVKNIDNSLIIVDEAHNLLNKNKYSQALKDLIEISSGYRIVLMSATPMVNEPEDIVEFANILFKKSEEIQRNDIFDEKNTLASDGLEKLRLRLRGIVSYVQGPEPDQFPRRIEIGSLFPGLKFTKVIRTPMSKIQYQAYQKAWHGAMTDEIKNILDFVLPGPHYKNLEEEIAAESDQYKKNVGIDVRDGKLIGPALLLENLPKYSGKYTDMIKNILNNYGNAFIFNKFVNNSGIKLIAEILRTNGFDEYGTPPRRGISRRFDDYRIIYSTGEFKSAKFFIFHQETPKEFGMQAIALFNSAANRDGSLIRIIIGSKLVQESLDLKRIRQIHIMNYQENFSRIEQIIGRGLRYGSHADLPIQERETLIYKYVASLPQKESLSGEELEYIKDETLYITIRKIVRMLKESSFDCSLNLDMNLRFVHGMDFSVLCDYLECQYNCTDDRGIIESLLYQKLDVFYAKEDIKRLFQTTPVYDFQSIVDAVGTSYIIPSTFIPNYTKEIVILALSELTSDQIVFKNAMGTDGYLITIGNNFLFQPKAIEDLTVDLNIRMSKLTVDKYIDLTDFLYEIIDLRGEKISYLVEDLFPQLELPYEDMIIRLSKYNIKQKIVLIEAAIIEYTKAGNIHPVYYNILKYFKNYLIDSLVSGEFHNRNHDPYFDNFSSMFKDPGKKFIGHFVGHVPRFLQEGAFVDKPEYFKKKRRHNLPENNYIVGYLEKNSEGEIIFKLRYTGGQKFRDLRKVKRGFVCHQINNKIELMTIAKTLGITLTDETTNDVCVLIEKTLRARQLDDPNVRWFYDFVET